MYLICASSVPINYFYMLKLFVGDFFVIHVPMYMGFIHFMELVDAYSFWANRVEINNQDY